jgi:hypothetical protein
MLHKESIKNSAIKDSKKNFGFFRKLKQRFIKKLSLNKEPITTQSKSLNQNIKEAKIRTQSKNKSNELLSEIISVKPDSKSEHFEEHTSRTPLSFEKNEFFSESKIFPIDNEKPEIIDKDSKLEPFETLNSTPYNLKKRLSLSQSTISSLDEKTTITTKSNQNCQLRKSVNYEASDEDIYMESFPTNNLQVEQDFFFRPLFKYLGVFLVNPDEYTRNYESELVDFDELPEYLQTVQEPPEYFDISISENNNLN